MYRIDLNCDMGESTALWAYSPARDETLLQYVSSVNLACGFHAGDAHTMHRLVEKALAAGVAVGAHPSFPDKARFGRAPMSCTPEEVYDLVLYQVGALDAFLKAAGGRLHHVKPHGALYNQAAKDPRLAASICRAVKAFDPGLILYGLAGSELIRAAKETGLRSCGEAFADRGYEEDGSLMPRSDPGALLGDVEAVCTQVLSIVRDQKVWAAGGKPVALGAGTICIHGDGERAVELARAIREMLTETGITVQRPETD